MRVKIYKRLSQVYDLDWGRFSQRYLGLISQLLEERAIAQARVLDLACGTGILAIELAKRGHFVHGIDISPEMIELAKQKSMDLPNVSLDVQDMAEFSVEDEFDLATCTFDSLNYLLDIDRVKAMFGRVASALHECGLFIFDSNTDRLYVNRHKGTYQRELGGESFVQRLSYDRVKRLATTVFEFSNGSVEVHKQHPYDLVELEPLLEDADLRVVSTFSNFDRQGYTSESERLICTARREAGADRGAGLETL